MKKEIERRLRALGISEEVIAEGRVLCYAGGYLGSHLQEGDEEAIEFIESSGCKVYLVTHDWVEGTPMNNYIYVSKNKEEWAHEFRDANKNHVSVSAFVSSPDTYGTFDVGAIYLKHENGHILRTSTMKG